MYEPMLHRKRIQLKVQKNMLLRLLRKLKLILKLNAVKGIL